MTSEEPESSRRRRPPKYVWPIVAWDTAWKLVAIRRALQLKDYKWIAGIALANSGGLVPMYYLWRNRGKS